MLWSDLNYANQWSLLEIECETWAESMMDKYIEQVTFKMSPSWIKTAPKRWQGQPVIDIMFCCSYSLQTLFVICYWILPHRGLLIFQSATLGAYKTWMNINSKELLFSNAIFFFSLRAKMTFNKSSVFQILSSKHSKTLKRHFESPSKWKGLKG